MASDIGSGLRGGSGRVAGLQVLQVVLGGGVAGVGLQGVLELLAGRMRLVLGQQQDAEQRVGLGRAVVQVEGTPEEQLGLGGAELAHGPLGPREGLVEAVRLDGRGGRRPPPVRVEGRGVAADHLGGDLAQLLGADRLLDEVDGPQLHRLDGVGHAAVRGDDHHGHEQALVAHPPQGGHAVDQRHAEVEEHQVERPGPAECGQGGLAVLGLGHVVADGKEGGAEHEPDVRLVVDDQDACRLVHRISSPPGRFATRRFSGRGTGETTSPGPPPRPGRLPPRRGPRCCGRSPPARRRGRGRACRRRGWPAPPAASRHRPRRG